VAFVRGCAAASSRQTQVRRRLVRRSPPLESVGQTRWRRIRDNLVELETVRQSYAYLIVEQKLYVVESEPEPGPVSESERDHGRACARGTFPDQVRDALEESARQAGYSSVETMMLSPRTLALTTPTRAEHVRNLVAAGLLNEDDAAVQRLISAVPDAAWAILSAIDPARGASQAVPWPDDGRATRLSRAHMPGTVESWSLAVHKADAVVAIAVDPKRCPARVLPVPLILEALDSLGADGWTVVHVSEDRSINDAASTSFVVRQRFLLRR
jgi:hypothetical protein